jgi:hypothetical protein
MQWPTFSKSGMAMVPSFDLHTATTGETSVDRLISLSLIHELFMQPWVGYV